MSALQKLLDSFEKDEFDEDAWNYYGRIDPAEAEMEYAALKTERDALVTVAVLAFLVVEEAGFGKLKPMMEKLDKFLAHEIPDDLWERINEAALKAGAK